MLFFAVAAIKTEEAHSDDASASLLSPHAKEHDSDEETSIWQ